MYDTFDILLEPVHCWGRGAQGTPNQNNTNKNQNSKKLHYMLYTNVIQHIIVV
jgi:hypothetical protein